MADSFILKDYAGTLTYNFLTGYIQIWRDGWTVQQSGAELWTETCMLVGRGADTSIIDAAADIDVLKYKASKWHESKKLHQSIWLEQHGDTETAKRALVYNIEFVPVPKGIHNPLLGHDGAFYQIAITRGAWEQTTITNYGTQSNVSSYGGSFTISDASVGGSKPARLARTTLTGVSGSGPLDRIWLGIKPTRDGVTGYDPRWEAEDAHYTHASTTTSTKSGAYGGTPNCLLIDLSTYPTYTNRFMIAVENVVGSNYAHMAGKYLALLRYQVPTADGSYYIGLMQGIGQFTHTCPIQYISYTSGNWRYLPMGVIDIPASSWRYLSYGDNYIRNFNLVFYAGESAGTGSELWVDSIVLVPYEHFFYSEGSALQNTGTATVTRLFMHEDSEIEAQSFDTSGQVDKVLIKHPNQWMMPAEGGKVVVVAERTSLTSTADVLNINVEWFQRYETHRDA